MTELVIFDCDGVLVDSERLAIKTDVVVLTELGLKLTETEAAERFVGLSMSQIRSDVEAQLGRPLPDSWEEEFHERLRTVFEAELRPVDGIVEALDSMSHRTCVASSGTHEKIEFSLSLTGLYEHFRGRIFSATEVERGKPAPDLFKHAAASMNVDPSLCSVVEDSSPGVIAGLAAGMRVFAYAGSVIPASQLNHPGVVVFEDMRVLPELLS